jgi:hypothetical protein
VLSGAVAETAPATDTASSGLNGRLQRIAQRLTTLITSGLGRTWTLGSGTDSVAVSGSVSVSNFPATQPISAASLPLPTGAAALAEQQAQTTSLQLIDDSVATVAAAITAKGVAAIGTDGTNARILKTDASGELQIDVITLPNVTVGAALPVGTNNIGDVGIATIAAGENHIAEVGYDGGVITANVTRPADTTAYASGDSISNSTTAPSPITLTNVARVNGGLITPASLVVMADSTAFAGAIRIHFYNSSPTAANDNAAFTTVDQTGYLGFVTATLANIGGRATGFVAAGDMPVLVAGAASRNLFLLVEAAAALTPTSGMTLDFILSSANG